MGGLRIRKVVSHPTKHSCILSSVQGNNEISMWNLETGSREKVYWASKAPPLSKPAVSFLIVSVIYTFISLKVLLPFGVVLIIAFHYISVTTVLNMLI